MFLLIWSASQFSDPLTCQPCKFRSCWANMSSMCQAIALLAVLSLVTDFNQAIDAVLSPRTCSAIIFMFILRINSFSLMILARSSKTLMWSSERGVPFMISLNARPLLQYPLALFLKNLLLMPDLGVYPEPDWWIFLPWFCRLISTIVKNHFSFPSCLACTFFCSS